MVGSLGCGCCSSGGGGGGGSDDPPWFPQCNCESLYDIGPYQKTDYTYGHDLPLPPEFQFQATPNNQNIPKYFRDSRVYLFPIDGLSQEFLGGVPVFVPNTDVGSGASITNRYETQFRSQLGLNERNYEYKIKCTTLQSFTPYGYIGTPGVFTTDSWFGDGYTTFERANGFGGFGDIYHGIVLKLKPPLPGSTVFQGASLHYLVFKPNIPNKIILYQEPVNWGTHELSSRWVTSEFVYPNTPATKIELRLNGIKKYEYNFLHNEYPFNLWFTWRKCNSNVPPDYRYTGCVWFSYENDFIGRNASGFYYAWSTNPRNSRYFDDFVFDVQLKR